MDVLSSTSPNPCKKHYAEHLGADLATCGSIFNCRNNTKLLVFLTTWTFRCRRHEILTKNTTRCISAPIWRLVLRFSFAKTNGGKQNIHLSSRHGRFVVHVAKSLQKILRGASRRRPGEMLLSPRRRSKLDHNIPGSPTFLHPQI